MSDSEMAPKRQKTAATAPDQNIIQVAGPSHRDSSSSSPSSPIFKLTADCCDDIFEYLSLEDLYSFGQTCKTFQKVAGEYFKWNHSAEHFNFDTNGLITWPGLKRYDPESPTRYSAFSQYVTKISCSDSTMLQYLAKHADEISSIKFLYCDGSTFKPNAVQKRLSKIDFLKLHDDYIESQVAAAEDMCKNLSALCPNLKCLFVEKRPHQRAYHDHLWLHQVYPHLEQLQFSVMPKEDDLNAFFKMNPGVRTVYLTQFENIWKDKDILLMSAIKLDLLEVDYAPGNQPEWIELLNELHERGFYKRLHLLLFDREKYNDKMATLQGLEKLTIFGMKQFNSFRQLTQLKRLNIICHELNPNQVEILAKELVNLEQMHCKLDDILPWLRYSKNLKKILLLTCYDEEGIRSSRVRNKEQKRVLDLPMLNKEREKLAVAQKVMIYVFDDMYLATKWATKNGDTNLSLVEMRRFSSFDWDNN